MQRRTDSSIIENGNEYQKLDSSIPDFKVAENESLYEALKNRNLLVEPIAGGLHLVKQGHIGLSMNNGKPEFLAPGRHTLFSPWNEFLGRADINASRIDLGPIQIVTINQGQLGLSVKNGKNIILDPGRYILEAPHQFVNSVQVNQQYINLGTHYRITVPQGFVAIARDNGIQEILPPGLHVKNSDTFWFDPATGFKSTQIEEIKLETLNVNTHEMIPVSVIGLIRYHISDAKKAFLEVDDVHSAIKLQAESTLTSVFSQLSIDKIKTSLSTTSVAAKNKGKDKAEPEETAEDDLFHEATEKFVKEFKKVVEKWGVTLDNLNIFSMNFTDKTFVDALRSRAQKRMDADTNLANITAINEVAIRTAENNKLRKIIEAQGEAEAISLVSSAQAEAAKKLSSDPLAMQLAVLNAQEKIAKAMGDKTTFMPHSMSVGGTSVSNSAGQMLFFNPQKKSGEPGQEVTAVQSLRSSK